MFHLQTYTYIIHCVYCVRQLYVSVEESSKINAKNLRHCFSVTAEWEFVIYTQKKRACMRWLSKLISCTHKILASSTNTQVKDLTWKYPWPVQTTIKAHSQANHTQIPCSWAFISFQYILYFTGQLAGACLPTFQLMINTCLGFLPQCLHSTTDILKPPNWGENINRSKYMATDSSNSFNIIGRYLQHGWGHY